MKLNTWSVWLALSLSTLFHDSMMAQSPSGIVFKVVVVEDGKEKPQPDAFIFARPTFHLSGQPQLVDWLKKHAAPPRESTLHKFEVRDGQLWPKALIAYVGDRIETKISDRYRLGLALFNNAPNCTTSTQHALHTFEPVLCYASLLDHDDSPSRPLLISDHTFSRLTDERGVAEFSELPPDMLVPLKVKTDARPSRNQNAQFTSETLTISSKGEFKVDTARPNQVHTIRIAIKELSSEK